MINRILHSWSSHKTFMKPAKGFYIKWPLVSGLASKLIVALCFYIAGLFCDFYIKRHTQRILHEWSFHMIFMKRAFGEFHDFH